MDSKHNIVVNVRITLANVNDVEPVAEILKDIEKRLGKQPKYMGLDAGYHSAPVCHQLASAGIQPAVGYRRHTHKGDYLGKYRFTYDPIKNVSLCPQGHELTWRTTNREGYREYWSDSRTCGDCPKRAECFPAKSGRRQVTRHVWQVHWSRRTRLRRQAAGNASTPGARKPWNDLSQKPKSCMACAMRACSESATCTSSPSSPPPCRT